MLTLESLANAPKSDDLTRVTSLAIMLDDAMARDPEARARYLAIYGHPWMSVSNARTIELAFALADTTGH